MKYGCIAKRLGHSFSREIHARLGNPEYQLLELEESDLPAFFRKREFLGINVTIPYKQTVLPYLDRVSETAERIGAVNTIVNRNGILTGYNTDFGGMTAALKKLGVPVEGKKALVLGSGGTGRTADAVLRSLGASEVITVSRGGVSPAVSYREAMERHSDASVLINATPCGMYPEPDAVPIEPERFPGLEGLFDAIFNPLSTELVLRAGRRGVPVLGGLYMLVAQAALASELFTGVPVFRDDVERIFREVRAEKENLVLIGMPGCGKTTVGAAAARILGRPFLDLDRRIGETVGMPVPDYIRTKGEDAFRQVEADTVREVSRETGLVIATGGGTVLRPDSVNRLRRNGCLFWLDRSVEAIRPTEDRPLSDSAEKLAALYRERLPVYRAAADRRIPGDGTPEETAARVAAEFTERKNK